MSERRLAAVMFVDVVGYTQLSQSNEELALRMLDEYRRLLRPNFVEHNGKEIKTIGDGFLVEFGSALESVRCGFSLQQSLHDINSSRPEAERLQARVGIHVGDVVHSQGDILGDAVNVASRIEPLAEPGGICISQPVQVQVRNKFEFPIISIGMRQLKNVDVPMEVFKISLPWDHRALEEKAATPRTRIAVLPFSNISPDQSDEYFADGMTEELINTISHNHQLKVIARTTVGRYKGTPKTILEIGKEIGVGTVLEGSVRKSGSKIRVTAQLIDARTEDHLWSENYDRELDDVFTIQSDIAKRVSEALMAELIPEEKVSVERKATKNPAAYVKYIRGRTLLTNRTQSGMKEAMRLFQEAITEDPSYADAYTGLADVCYLLSNYRYLPKAQTESIRKDALAKSLKLDDGLAETHNTLAEYLANEFKFDEAEKEFKRAISINPSYSLAHHWYSICLLEMGRDEESLNETKLAVELDPLSPALAMNITYWHSRVGMVAEAQEHLRKLRELDSGNQFTDFLLAIIADDKKDYRSAMTHMEEVVKRHPYDNDHLAYLGYCFGKVGMLDKANEVLETLRRTPNSAAGEHHNLARLYWGMGKFDDMFREFDLAVDERTMLFRVLRYTTDDQMKADPRYRQLFEKVGLSPS